MFKYQQRQIDRNREYVEDLKNRTETQKANFIKYIIKNVYI